MLTSASMLMPVNVESFAANSPNVFTLNFQKYDWPMEGYILPYAPKLHKKEQHDDGLSGSRCCCFFLFCCSLSISNEDIDPH